MHEQTTIGIHRELVPKLMYTLFYCNPVITKWENCLQPQRCYFRKWFLLCKRHLFCASKGTTVPLGNCFKTIILYVTAC